MIKLMLKLTTHIKAKRKCKFMSDSSSKQIRIYKMCTLWTNFLKL